MEAVLLSVIIPVHNAEAYLDACISSMVNQTYTSLEIILVDDGSEDRSYEICKKWKEQDDRIVLFRFENCKGVVCARQKGIELSTADYVTYVDSDDYMELDAFEKMMTAILENDADLLISTGRFHEFGDRQAITKDAIEAGVYEGVALDEIRRKMIAVEIWPNLWNHIFKKERHGEYLLRTDMRIIINEDITAMMMTIMHCDRVAVIDEILYHYVLNTHSITRTFKTEYLESNCLMYSLVKEEMLGTHREYLLQSWKEHFIEKLFMNIRIECSRDNSISFFDKMQHLKDLYQHPVLKEFIREGNTFDLEKRDAMIWRMVQKNRTWSLYFCLKIWAVIELVKVRIG